MLRRVLLFGLAWIFLTGLLLAEKQITDRKKLPKMTSTLLLKKMRAALGGLKKIQRLHILYFKWKLAASETGNSKFTAEQIQLVGRGKEWIAMNGSDHLDMSSAFGGAPVVEVLSNGEQMIPIPITVSSSTEGVLPGSGTCSKTTVNPLCVNEFPLYFDQSLNRTVLRASKNNFTGTIFEKNTCSGIASVIPESGRGSQTSFTITADHPGKCSVTLMADSPAAWLLNGDQGALGTSSGSTATGQISGPDLSREISKVYWKSFAYLTSLGLPGKVHIIPEIKGCCYVLKMLPDGGDPIKAYINKRSFLTEKIQIGADDDPTMEIMTFRGWKPIGGIKFPFKILDRSVDPFTGIPSIQEYIMTRVRINPVVAKGLFAEPQPAI